MADEFIVYLTHMNWRRATFSNELNTIRLCRWIDFSGKTGILFPDQNRSPVFPERFLIAIMIAIAVSKSLIDFRTKIGIRFCVPSVLVVLKLFFNR